MKNLFNHPRITQAVFAGALVLAVPFIQSGEGRELVTYRDIAGIATYCDGETEGAVMGKTYTHAECDAITLRRVEQFARGVAKCLKVDVTKYQLAAHTSLAYNIGLGNYCASTAVRLTNAGQPAAGCQAMDKFVCISVAPGKGDSSGPCKKGDLSKKFVRGLQNRRDKEIAMCLRPDEPAIVADSFAESVVKPWWKFWG